MERQEEKAAVFRGRESVVLGFCGHPCPLCLPAPVCELWVPPPCPQSPPGSHSRPPPLFMECATVLSGISPHVCFERYGWVFSVSFSVIYVRPNLGDKKTIQINSIQVILT